MVAPEIQVTCSAGKGRVMDYFVWNRGTLPTIIKVEPKPSASWALGLVLWLIGFKALVESWPEQALSVSELQRAKCPTTRKRRHTACGTRLLGLRTCISGSALNVSSLRNVPCLNLTRLHVKRWTERKLQKAHHTHSLWMCHVLGSHSKNCVLLRLWALC